MLLGRQLNESGKSETWKIVLPRDPEDRFDFQLFLPVVLSFFFHPRPWKYRSTLKGASPAVISRVTPSKIMVSLPNSGNLFPGSRIESELPVIHNLSVRVDLFFSLLVKPIH